MANIFIYGSCVSRDAVAFMSAEHRLIDYVARQSLISAMSPATNLLSGDSLNSSFQNRMLEGDIASSLTRHLRRFSKDIDLIVIDLTDERLGVHALPDRSFVTRSSELVKSKRLESINPLPKLTRLGTERHRNLWNMAAGKFVSTLEKTNLAEKVLVMDTQWASITDNSTVISANSRYSMTEMNGFLNDYSSYLSSLGLRVVSMPNELAIAGSDHKWGLAPYHYSEPAYRWMVEQWNHAISH